MHRLLAALLAAASCATVAQAQTAPSVAAEPPFTLQLALTLANDVDPSLDVAEADLEAAAAARQLAGLRPNPSVMVEAENVAGSGLYRNTDSLEATTSVSLPLELGGKRSARIAVADARASRAMIEATTALADLTLAVTQAYAEAVAAEQQRDAAREQLRIAADGLRAADIRVRAGRASPIEVQRAEVARLNADALAEQAERQATVTRFVLSQRVGRAVTAPLDIEWFGRVSVSQGPLRPIDGEGTLAMAAANADLAIADAGVRLARSQRVPDLTLGAGVRRFEETNDSAALFSLSIPIPLFNRGGAAHAQALAEQGRADAQRRMTALDVAQAIARAQADAANAATLASTASGPALQAAEEAARIARIGYREGKFGQLDLLDAERTLAETRQGAIAALLTYHLARARFERLIVRAPSVQGD